MSLFRLVRQIHVRAVETRRPSSTCRHRLSNRHFLRRFTMSTLRGRLFASLSALLLPLCAMPAEAHRVWPMVGVHPGDATVTMMCRPGSYLSGFNGRAGLWLDAVQIICADAHGPAGPQSDVFGGTGGGPVTASCAADQDRPGLAFHLSRSFPDDGWLGVSFGGCSA